MVENINLIKLVENKNNRNISGYQSKCLLA